MYNLVIFFREAYDSDDSIRESTARKLSTQSEPELRNLLQSVEHLKATIEAELVSRAQVEEQTI